MSLFGAAQSGTSSSPFAGFGQNQAQQQAGTNNGNGTGGSLFGSFGQNQQNQNQNQQQNQQSAPGTSLFGQNQSTGSSLFGQPQQNQTGSSLFGQNQNQNQNQNQQSSSLFGQPQQQQQQQNTGSSLFGQPQQNQTSSLFGQPQQNQTTGSSLFGQPQQNQTGSSLFGQSQQNQTGSSLFGQPQQNQNSLFGGQSTQAAGQSLFGQQQQPQQQQSGSLFGQSQQQPGSMSLSGQNQSRALWQPSAAPREKTIPEQMQTLLEKWSPQSNSCLFQYYFYNHVNPETLPYYGPEPGEDETKWEEALSKKPSEDAIPVLCKGFSALGNRLRVQVQSVSALQSRLHEINHSLTAMLQAHEVDISVRVADARRRHTTLGQRTIRLAARIQVLRNRGYALDGAEEGLRKHLLELEKQAFDPRLTGRQEEVWSRMVGLRDRLNVLQEEADRIGHATDRAEQLDPEVLKKARKILGDYDVQITHLARELDSVKVDFDQWQGGAGV